MKTFINRIPVDLKNIFTLIAGNGIAILIPVMASPILTRLYSSTDFGLFTIYVSLISIFSSFATGRYDYAILSSRTEKNINLLLKLSLIIAVITSLMVLLVLFLFKDKVLMKLNIDAIGNLIYLVPINIFLFSTFGAFINYLNRIGDYSFISTSKSAKSGSVLALQVGLGYSGFLSIGLIVGKFISDLVIIIFMYLRVKTKITKFKVSESIYRIKSLARINDKYPKFNSFHALINTLSISAVPLFLGYLFNQKTVGYFGLSLMVSIVPIQLIGSAFYQVFSVSASERVNNKESISKYAFNTLIQLCLIAIIPFIVLSFYGIEIFELIFGAEWSTSGKFVELLTPYLFIVFIVSPFTYIPLVFNKHATSLKFEILLFIGRLTFLSLGAIYFDEFVAIWAFGIFSFIVQSIYLNWIFSLTRRKS